MKVKQTTAAIKPKPQLTIVFQNENIARLSATLLDMFQLNKHLLHNNSSIQYHR